MDPQSIKILNEKIHAFYPPLLPKFFLVDGDLKLTETSAQERAKETSYLSDSKEWSLVEVEAPVEREGRIQRELVALLETYQGKPTGNVFVYKAPE